jgi:hypothetical protein
MTSISSSDQLTRQPRLVRVAEDFSLQIMMGGDVEAAGLAPVDAHDADEASSISTCAAMQALKRRDLA